MARTAKTVTVTQVRSAIGRPKDQKACLSSLGLGKIGHKKEHTLTPSTIGMIEKVSHLVTVQEIR